MSTVEEALAYKYASRRPDWGFGGMGELVFKRSYARELPEEGRKENWNETLARVIRGVVEIESPLADEDLEELYDLMFGFKCSVSGRGLWQLGVSGMIERAGQASLNNCYATEIASADDFCFVMDMLMAGGGVGFSVERALVHQLPVVRSGVEISHERTADADFIVPDSREGWSALLREVLRSFFETGRGFTYSTILVRPEGSPLLTFGGTASGPGALIEGITDVCRVLAGRENRRVRPVDALDVCNIIGKIVVAGSARRSAELSAGDPDDLRYMRAKYWGGGGVPAWRENSNNSILADSYEEIPPQFWATFAGDAEPYGLINRRLLRTQGRLGEPKNDGNIVGTNPCGEIGLEHHESCNLATLYLPRIDSYEELVRCSELLYYVQKTVASLPHPDPVAQRVIARNMRLGQSVTGLMEASQEQLDWLHDAYEELDALDVEYSALSGFPLSKSLTSIQPSGTQSLMAGVTPGVKAAESRWYLRRVRTKHDDPLADSCEKRGNPVEYDIGIDGSVNHSRKVITFPVETPPHAVFEADLHPVDHLEMIKELQTTWADNAISATVRYRDDQLGDVRAWLAENYEHGVKSVSFMLEQDHGFKLPPYEPCDEATYKRLSAGIDLTIPLEGGGDDPMPFADCDGGACPIR